MNKKAATLVEIMIYFALLAVFLTVAVTFSLQIINSSHQIATESDLATELTLIRSKLQAEILKADTLDLTGSVLGVPNGTLSLTMEDAVENPTVFSLNEGNLQLIYGTSEPVIINSNALSFDSLQFQVYSSEKAPDHIVIDAVVSVESELDVKDATVDFHLASSLRP